MSDLHCAATLLLVPHREAAGLAPALRGARVAQVWSAASDAALSAATALAADLGVGIAEHRGLLEAAVLERPLTEIADQHRGETVVVVVDHGDAILEVAIDGDGWTRRRWTPPGT